MNEMAQTSEAQIREQRLSQMRSGDKSHDGTFLFGVRTTGIYCLPSCHARKPLPENVLFFDHEAEAVALGLRACRKCRPDNFYQNHDPAKEILQNLAAQIKAAPEKWTDATELAQASGFGATKLFALFRQHFKTTPLLFVRHTRMGAACDALTRGDGAGIADVAFTLGCESLSAFHAQFRAETGLAPGQYRDWANGKSGDFTLTVSPFCFNYARRIHCRDSRSLSERETGDNGFAKAFFYEEQAAVLIMERHKSGVYCRVEAASPTPAVRRAAHRVALRVLGMAGGNATTAEQTAWEKKADTNPVFARLIGDRRGLRVPLTSDVWESVAWAIIGQQINLPFAWTLRRVVCKLSGPKPTGASGLIPFPAAQAVARLEYADLTGRQFSQRKAEYLIDTARAVATGTLCLDALQSGMGTPFGDAEKTLLALRGLGPWSAHYILMRGCGWPDCVPIGDTGITAGLRKLYALDHAPGKEEAARLMEPFAPFRSLATHHLWESLAEEN